MKKNVIKTPINGIEYVADFNSKHLVKEVSTPYPLYNGYLDMVSDIFNNNETPTAKKLTYSATAGTIYETSVEFKIYSTLREYCDYVAKDMIPNVYLYNELKRSVDNIIVLLSKGTLIQSNTVNKDNALTMVFTLSSMIFNDTIDCLYAYGIEITDKVYNDITIANVLFSRSIENNLCAIIDDYNNHYREYLEYHCSEE